MNTVIPNPLFAPHLHGNPRLSPSRSELHGGERMSGRKRKASDDDLDDRMSTSPSASPSVASRHLPALPRSIKRTRTASTPGRPLDLPRLLETLNGDEVRDLLLRICDQNPTIANEVVTKAPRPSVDSTLSVLSRYETALKAAIPFGNRPGSDYTYNRVRVPLQALIEALRDYTPHFLPPNETQTGTSLSYLDAVTGVVQRLPTWDTWQHNAAKHDAYEELSHAWALVVQEGAKKGGGFLLQFGGWDQKLLKHNEDSGGRLQVAVDALRTSLGWGAEAGPSTTTGQAATAADERAAIRQQILSGTYGADLSVGGGRRW